MRITREYLVSLGACAGHVGRFDRAFPSGLDVIGDPTTEVLDTIAASGLDLGWFASRLPAEARAAWDRATAEPRAAYRRARAEADAAWDRATAEPRAEYDRATAEADRATAEPAEAAYTRATAEAGAAYRRATAEALWRIVASLPV